MQKLKKFIRKHRVSFSLLLVFVLCLTSYKIYRDNRNLELLEEYSQKELWHYSNLKTDKEKLLYIKIKEHLPDRQSLFYTYGLSFVDVQNIVTIIKYDDPTEISYVSTYHYIASLFDEDKIDFIYLNYAWSFEQQQAEVEDCDTIVEDTLQIISEENETDYEKELAVYNYISSIVEYEHSVEDRLNTIESVREITGLLKEGKANCTGYANTFKYMLNKLGIDCEIVTGYVNDGEHHAWNIVKLDGEWYYCDLCWDDTDKMTLPRHSYFNMTYDEVVKDRTLDQTYAPQDNANTYDYFALTNQYADTEEDVNQILRNAVGFMRGTSAVEIKCTTDEFYTLMKSKILDVAIDFTFNLDSTQYHCTMGDATNTFYLYKSK